MYEKLDADTIKCIKMLRKEGYTRDQIAYELEVSAGAVSKYSKGISRGKHTSQPQPSRHSCTQEHYFPDYYNIETEKTTPQTQDPAEQNFNQFTKSFESISHSQFQNFLYHNYLKKQTCQLKPKPKPKPDIIDVLVEAERQKILDKERQRIQREILGDQPSWK